MTCGAEALRATLLNAYIPGLSLLASADAAAADKGAGRSTLAKRYKKWKYISAQAHANSTQEFRKLKIETFYIRILTSFYLVLPVAAVYQALCALSLRRLVCRSLG